MLRLVTALAFAFLFIAAPVHGQSQGQGFASAGRLMVGDDSGQLTLSAGGERIADSGLSVGADVLMSFGRTRARPRFPNGQPYRQYLLSAFVGAQARAMKGLAPFVNGGVSVVTDPDCCGPGAGWNIGGGANYWLTRRFGIRGDARLVLAFSGEAGLVLGRVGMVFR